MKNLIIAATVSLALLGTQAFGLEVVDKELSARVVAITEQCEYVAKEASKAIHNILTSADRNPYMEPERIENHLRAFSSSALQHSPYELFETSEILLSFEGLAGFLAYAIDQIEEAGVGQIVPPKEWLQKEADAICFFESLEKEMPDT